VLFELDHVEGIKNMVFGNGIFLAELTGPGRVWLQTLPLPALAGSLIPYLPSRRRARAAAAGWAAPCSTTAERRRPGHAPAGRRHRP